MTGWVTPPTLARASSRRSPLGGQGHVGTLSHIADNGHLGCGAAGHAYHDLRVVCLALQTACDLFFHGPYGTAGDLDASGKRNVHCTVVHDHLGRQSLGTGAQRACLGSCQGIAAKQNTGRRFPHADDDGITGADEIFPGLGITKDIRKGFGIFFGAQFAHEHVIDLLYLDPFQTSGGRRMLYLYTAGTGVGHDRTTTEHHGQQAANQSGDHGIFGGHQRVPFSGPYAPTSGRPVRCRTHCAGQTRKKAQACRFFLYRRMDDGLYIDALCKKLIGQSDGLARAAQDDGDDGITLSIAYVEAGFTGQIQKKRAAFP